MSEPVEYSVSKAREDFSALVKRAEEGEEAVITVAGRPAVRLVPVGAARRSTRTGLGNGEWTLISINVHSDSLPAGYPELPPRVLEQWLPEHSEWGIAWGHLTEPVAIYAVPTEWSGGGTFSYFRAAFGPYGTGLATELVAWTARLGLSPEHHAWSDQDPGSFARTQSLAIAIGNEALGIAE